MDDGGRDAGVHGGEPEQGDNLIWSGEIDSYRLGRKLLVSRASVDAYIGSRSGRK